ncbi:hypothetical protein [Virgibacillus sp. L01]|uniref:hypothetical protein n=1 Tax=Virgibacillus sp. L01 TaxID=3457429 RepID=UPI003FD3EDCC
MGGEAIQSGDSIHAGNQVDAGSAGIGGSASNSGEAGTNGSTVNDGNGANGDATSDNSTDAGEPPSLLNTILKSANGSDSFIEMAANNVFHKLNIHHQL